MFYVELLNSCYSYSIEVKQCIYREGIHFPTTGTRDGN